MTLGPVGVAVDFVFLIDGSESMRPWIQSLTKQLDVFAEMMTHRHTPVSDWRGKVVVYRTSSASAETWMTVEPFVSNDIGALRAQFKGIALREDPGQPGSLIGAMYAVASMGESMHGAPLDPFKWRSPGNHSRRLDEESLSHLPPGIAWAENEYAGITYPPSRFVFALAGDSRLEVDGQRERLQEFKDVRYSTKLKWFLLAPDVEPYRVLADEMMADRSRFFECPLATCGRPGLRTELATSCEDRVKDFMAALVGLLTHCWSVGLCADEDDVIL